jgi:adenine phosphoribosyltransferase
MVVMDASGNGLGLRSAPLHHDPVATDAVSLAREAFLSRFEWHAGHADVWGAFADGTTLRALVDGLAAPWRDAGITRVVGVESRGFLLGGAVAVALGVGFQAVRKPGALFPGAKLTMDTEPDYRGNRHTLSMQDALNSSDVVLMVDDWAERGAQAWAVRSLVERGGARFAGLSLVVNQLDARSQGRLARVTWLIDAEELSR